MGKSTEKISHHDTCIENVFTASYCLCIFVSQLVSVKFGLHEAELPPESGWGWDSGSHTNRVWYVGIAYMVYMWNMVD